MLLVIPQNIFLVTGISKTIQITGFEQPENYILGFIPGKKN